MTTFHAAPYPLWAAYWHTADRKPRVRVGRLAGWQRTDDDLDPIRPAVVDPELGRVLALAVRSDPDVFDEGWRWSLHTDEDTAQEWATQRQRELRSGGVW